MDSEVVALVPTTASTWRGAVACVWWLVVACIAGCIEVVLWCVCGALRVLLVVPKMVAGAESVDVDVARAAGTDVPARARARPRPCPCPVPLPK